MLNSVVYLCSFGVVESVECADKITGNSANTLKFNVFANLTVYILNHSIHLFYLLYLSVIAVAGNWNAGELLSQFVQSFNRYGFAFASSAARANVIDNSREAAYGVSVNGVVNGTVTDADLFHVADDRFKRLRAMGLRW